MKFPIVIIVLAIFVLLFGQLIPRVKADTKDRMVVIFSQGIGPADALYVVHDEEDKVTCYLVQSNAYIRGISCLTDKEIAQGKE